MLSNKMQARLRTVLCCTVLQIGALLGAPMRPEEIQELMRSLNAPKVAQTTPEEQPSGDGPSGGEGDDDSTV